MRAGGQGQLFATGAGRNWPVAFLQWLAAGCWGHIQHLAVVLPCSPTAWECAAAWLCPCRAGRELLTPRELCCPVLPTWGTGAPLRGCGWGQEEDGAAALRAPSPPEGSCFPLTLSSFPLCPSQQHSRRVALLPVRVGGFGPSVGRRVGVALTLGADPGHAGHSHCHSLSRNGPCALRVLRQAKLNQGSIHGCWSLEQGMPRAGCGGSVLCPWGSSTESQPGCSVNSWDGPWKDLSPSALFLGT